MSNKKTTTITVKLPDEYAVKFRDNANKNNWNQSEYLIHLLKHDLPNEDNIFPQKRDENEINSFLLQHKNVYVNKNIQSKLFNFDGELIYRSFAREYSGSARQTLKEELNLPEEYDLTFNPYMNNQEKPYIQSSYQFAIYENSDGKYILCESIYVNQENIEMVAKSRCQILKDREELSSKLNPYVTANEMRQIELLLADQIQNTSELEDFL